MAARNGGRRRRRHPMRRHARGRSAARFLRRHRLSRLCRADRAGAGGQSWRCHDKASDRRVAGLAHGWIAAGKSRAYRVAAEPQDRQSAYLGRRQSHLSAAGKPQGPAPGANRWLCGGIPNGPDRLFGCSKAGDDRDANPDLRAARAARAIALHTPVLGLDRHRDRRAHHHRDLGWGGFHRDPAAFADPAIARRRCPDRERRPGPTHCGDHRRRARNAGRPVQRHGRQAAGILRRPREKDRLAHARTGPIRGGAAGVRRGQSNRELDARSPNRPIDDCLQSGPALRHRSGRHLRIRRAEPGVSFAGHLRDERGDDRRTHETRRRIPREHNC